MGARRAIGPRWFIASQLERCDPELVRAAARAAYEQACNEWLGQEQARLARAIIVTTRKDQSAIRRALDAFAQILTAARFRSSR